jgi:hypothetical protein
MPDDATVVSFKDDMTARWSCRQGDYALWVRYEGILEDSYRLVDVWEMHDGDFITITNRVADLPVWFELQPDEVCNQAAFDMMRKINEGWQPGESVDGPNLWRACAGDRVVWVGPARPTNRNTGVQCLASLDANALVVMESSRPDFDPLDAMNIAEGMDSPEAKRLVRAGYDAACKLGTPNTFATEWTLG